MKSHLVFFSILASIVLVFMGACNQAPGTPNQSVSPTSPSSSPDDAYPAPDDQAYPQPEEAQPAVINTPGPTPTTASGTGKFTGTMLLAGHPVIDASLYLGEILPNTQGEDTVAALDIFSSPRTFTNEKGEFTFYNVPPGKYGLILDVVKESYLLHDPATNNQIIIIITADQEINLGVVDFEKLPIP